MSIFVSDEGGYLSRHFFNDENDDDFSALNLIVKKEKFKEEKYDFRKFCFSLGEGYRSFF